MKQQVVSRFHNDLLGALLAKVRLDFGRAAESADLSIKALGGRADRQKLERLTELAGTSNELPKAYLAGLKLYEEQVSADLVLDGLSWQAESRFRISRVISRTVIYLLILSCVAVAGIAFHQTFVTPTIEWSRSDAQLDLAPSAVRQTDDIGTVADKRLESAAVGVSVASLAALLILALIGPAKLVGLIGGRQYQSDLASLVATRVARELIAGQTDKQQAIAISADLVGNDSLIDQKTRETIGSTDDRWELCTRLDSLSAYFRASARDRMTVMRSIVPTTMIILIGGLIALAYGLAVFYPFVELMNDFARGI